jgi:hypothetical protein
MKYLAVPLVLLALFACSPSLLPRHFTINFTLDATSSAVARTYTEDYEFDGSALVRAHRSWRIVGHGQNDTCQEQYDFQRHAWVETVWHSADGARPRPCYEGDENNTLTITRSYIENGIRNGTLLPLAPTNECRMHSCYTITT